LTALYGGDEVLAVAEGARAVPANLQKRFQIFGKRRASSAMAMMGGDNCPS